MLKRNEAAEIWQKSALLESKQSKLTFQVFLWFINSSRGWVDSTTAFESGDPGSNPWRGKHFFCSIDKENPTKICTLGNQLFNFHSTNQVLHFNKTFPMTIDKWNVSKHFHSITPLKEIHLISLNSSHLSIQNCQMMCIVYCLGGTCLCTNAGMGNWA